jgi:hypothetical protein
MSHKATETIRVEATAVGYYNDIFRRAGDVFDLQPRPGTYTERVVDKNGTPKVTRGTLADVPIPVTREVQKVLTADEQFNPRWMKRVASDTPAIVHRLGGPKVGAHTQPLAPPKRSVSERS